MHKLLAVVTVGVVAAVACDVAKTANQLQASTVMIGTVLATPPVEVDPLALAGFDGGVTLSDAGTVTLPDSTHAFVFVGNLPHKTLDTPPTPNRSALVSVRAGGVTTVLDNNGDGTYSKQGSSDAGFAYQSGADYEFFAEISGEAFVGTVKEAPALERIPELHPPAGYVSHQANQSLSLTRAAQTGDAPRNLGFVTVVPLNASGLQGQPTYTNIPTSPLDFLKLVITPAEWRGSPVTIPGSAFPNANTTYLVTFQASKLGGATSANLFAGSALMVGTADVGLVKTH